MRTIQDYSLYLVISEECCLKRSVLDVARQGIAGGADIIQMREKHKSLQELVAMGTDIARLCKEKRVLFIVNDNPMLTQRIGADGVHLGQKDIDRFPLKTVRDIIGRQKIVGISTSSRYEFEKANDEDVDYIAFGPVFPTTLKDRHIGTGDIEHVMRIAKKPVFFIGGIAMSNIGEILQCGGRNVAVIRAITEAPDVTLGARQLKKRLCEQKNVDEKEART